MSEELLRAREDRDRAVALTRQRVECDETLRHTAYRLDVLELHINSIDKEIERLDSSVCGMLIGLFSDKQQRIDTLRTQRSSLVGQFKDAEEALDQAQRALDELDRELAGLADAEARYAAALAQKLQDLPDGAIAESEDAIERLQDAARLTALAADLAESTVGQMGTARRSALHINKRRKRGLIVAPIYNAMMDRAKRPGSDEVVRALERFLGALDDAGAALRSCDVSEWPVLERAFEEVQREGPGWMALSMDSPQAADMECTLTVMAQRLRDTGGELRQAIERLEAEQRAHVEKA